MQFRKFDANLIFVLDALLQENSVTLAAQRLGRSPSAVSHSLSSLRHVFQDRLFVRSGQKLVPTARSLALKSEVHELVDRLENLVKETGE